MKHLLYFLGELKAGILFYDDLFKMYDDEMYESSITDYSNIKITAEEQIEYLTLI